MLISFVRMIMAAVSSYSEPLIKAIGAGVLCSVCADICAILSFLIYLIVKNGDRWRRDYYLEKLSDLFEPQSFVYI